MKPKQDALFLLFPLLVTLLLGRNNQDAIIVVDAFVSPQPVKLRGSKYGCSCILSPYDRSTSKYSRCFDDRNWGLALHAAKSSGK
jgi:hypothetical protein